MKPKNILFAAVLVTLASACGENYIQPNDATVNRPEVMSSSSKNANASLSKSQIFTVGDLSKSLKNANLYFVQEDACTSEPACAGNGPIRTARGYVITDGTFVSGGGVWLSDYNGATYVIVIGLLSTDNGSITTGSYYQNRDWVVDNYPNPYTWNGTERLSFLGYSNNDDPTDPTYILAETAGNTNDGLPDTNGQPIVVTGGVEDGDMMIIRFSGTLDMGYAGGGETSICCQPATLSFKGKVQKTF